MSPELDRVAALVRGLHRPVVLIDGRSGAGKTTLARELAPALDAQLVSLDDVYPGWDGLEAASRTVPAMLRGQSPGFLRWDWGAGRAAGWHPLDPARALVVEGCGALTRAARPLASAAVWMDGPAAERRRRALERDPDFAGHWDGWAAQESAHIAREHPEELADLVLRL